MEGLSTGTRTLWILTALVFALACVAIFALDANSLSALGTIVSAAGGLLAVLWFSASLRYQAIQLKEQRDQFKAQFEYLREGGRREALVLAKGILETAEAQVIAAGYKDLASLVKAYMDCKELKPLTESRDPEEVRDAFESWSKKEVPALSLLVGIRAAAEVYLRSLNQDGIDYQKPPEDFYYIYSAWLEKLPFFSRLHGPAYMLAHTAMMIQPGRAAAMIAFFVANDMLLPQGIVNREKVLEDIATQRANNKAVPAIADGW